MSNDSGEDREQGVEFGDLMEKIERVDYPVTNETVVEEYGDETLNLEGRTVTLRETIGSQGDVTYEDSEQVRQAIFNMVGEQAVGRKGYTDRGTDTESEATRDQSDESF
jgi:hypothetical protein